MNTAQSVAIVNLTCAIHRHTDAILTNALKQSEINPNDIDRAIIYVNRLKSALLNVKAITS